MQKKAESDDTEYDGGYGLDNNNTYNEDDAVIEAVSAAEQDDGLVKHIFSEEVHPDDWYVHEAVDANIDAAFVNTPSLTERSSETKIHFSPVPLDDITREIALLKAQVTKPPVTTYNVMVIPTVFLMDRAQADAAICLVAEQFTLNVDQIRAFRIVAEHSLGFGPLHHHLLMGIFGEGGTGKSTLIGAIRHWFDTTNQSSRLISTASTGSAAVKINGSTLHSAVGIAIETGDDPEKKAMKTVSDRQALAWKDIDYIIIDEVSIIDAKVLMQLNDKLNLLKSSNQAGNSFGGTQ